MDRQKPQPCLIRHAFTHPAVLICSSGAANFFERSGLNQQGLCPPRQRSLRVRADRPHNPAGYHDAARATRVRRCRAHSRSRAGSSTPKAVALDDRQWTSRRCGP